MTISAALALIQPLLAYPLIEINAFLNTIALAAEAKKYRSQQDFDLVLGVTTSCLNLSLIMQMYGDGDTKSKVNFGDLSSAYSNLIYTIKNELTPTIVIGDYTAGISIADGFHSLSITKLADDPLGITPNQALGYLSEILADVKRWQQ